MARAPAFALRIVPGDYRAAWDRTVALLRRLGFAVDGQSATDGTIRATRRRLLGRVEATLRFEEIETGEVEVRVEATASGLADAGAAVAEIEGGLPGR